MVRRQLSRKAITNIRRRSVRFERQRGGEMINVKFYDQYDMINSVKVPHDATVLQLKREIANKMNIFNADIIELSIFLNNKKNINSYGISNNSVLNLNFEDKNLEERQTASQDEFEY